MNETAIVTGGARRLGQSIAMALADSGFHIALIYQNSADDAMVTKVLIEQKSNVQCELFQVDLATSGVTSDLISRVCAVLPALRLLINNASTLKSHKFSQLTEAEFDRDFYVNFKSPLFLTKAFAAVAGTGHIINIIDGSITKLATSRFDYLLAKKALWEFTRMAALELAPNFRVNAISPGPILPPAGENQDYLAERGREIPLQRSGRCSDVVAALHFLLQNDFITGQNIYVDGGMHL